ncbi:L,D-transpeptidase family protein [Streptomyces sp. NPDC020719]|uniref:L,D-transpeptidase family protein n=1 Tax=Streptomyces sp. NPDC020719 TaxID=3154896 RepID=UPI0033CEC4A1
MITLIRSRLRQTISLGLFAALAIGLTAESASAAPSRPASAPPEPACTADTGPYQWQLEQYLKLPADGRQSPADCAAIRTFQAHNGIVPADGYASLATYRTTLVIEEHRAPNKAGKCPRREDRIVCVDLERQLLWVQRDGRVIYPAVAVRSGRWGQQTRDGWHEITERRIDDHSELYDNAPMPYAQYFSGGQAFHGVYGDLFNGGGSAGCINLRLSDAQRLWNTIEIGDAVFIWGQKPATGTVRSASAAHR